MLGTALAALGIVLLLAPVAADAVGSWRARQSAEQATDAAAAIDERERDELLEQARAYNEQLAGQDIDTDVLPYDEQLASSADGVMATLRIAAIGLELPVYHGTDDATLAAGCGHVETSSLPVGGTSSNCVLAGHSGALSGRMFEDLRELAAGDIVELDVLGQTLYYRVESLAVVAEDDTQALQVQEGRDIVTLVTCTSAPNALMPYGGIGVNDMRLVVVAVRCEGDEAATEGSGLYISGRARALLAAAAATGCLCCGRRIHTGLRSRGLKRKRGQHT